ncbi:transposase [Calothrix sp. NIES-3974]|nr:transposase [Calothrix sp. NIES-3974]
MYPKSIHAVTYEGFLLKLQAFIFAFTVKQAFLWKIQSTTPDAM